MASPLGSSSQNQIKEFEEALDQFIQKAQSGNQDSKALSAIQNRLKSLLNNPKIPEHVQQSLQAAANELKQLQTGKGNIDNLNTAKQQLHSLLSGEEEEKGPSGGSLGGGGGGSEE